MRLSFNIAKKFLLSSKAQTTLIIFGIAIGISVQLFIGLLIQGLQNDLINSTVGDSAHISISSGDEFFNLDPQLIDDLADVEGINTVMPILSKDILIKGDDEYGVIVNGIIFEDDIYSLNDKLVEGRLPSDSNEIVVGIGLDLQVGDKVSAIAIDKEAVEFTVSGVFDYGNTTFNENYIYTSLMTLQNFLDEDNQISGIEIQIDNVFESETIASEINLSNYEVTTWQEVNQGLLSALSSQSLSSRIIQVFVVVSVVLAISSVLIISVVQKSKQIGILKAMGLNNKGISYVFLSQGLILGFMGSVLGVGIGLGLLLAFAKFAVDDNGTAIISIDYSMQFILLSFSIGVISSIISSIIPAYKSKKLSAIEVISNG